MKYTKNDLNIFPSYTGVYAISFSNNTNGKIYIGSASATKSKIKKDNGFHSRWRKHIHDLSKNKSKTALQYAANKYGLENILFEIIEECDSKFCLDREQFYIDKYNSYNVGYNSRPIASNNGGLIWTYDQRKKMGETCKENRDSYYEEIKKLYDDGKTTREISIFLGISRNRIRLIFVENNIVPRKGNGLKKSIFRYDMSGNLIDNFNSITECARELNVNKHSIKLVLQNKCRHCNNFYYSYDLLSNEEFVEKMNNLNKKLTNRKYINVMQLDENENEIKIWNNIKEIVEFYSNMNCNAIRKSLKENIKYKGFYWRV